MLTNRINILICDLSDKLKQSTVQNIESHNDLIQVYVSKSRSDVFQAMIQNDFAIYVICSFGSEKKEVTLLDRAKLYGLSHPVIFVFDGHRSKEDHPLLHGAFSALEWRNFTPQVLTKMATYAWEVHSEDLVDKERARIHQIELGALKEKYRSVLDSIKYAKNIQDCLLITRPHLHRIFGDFMIVYRPRDVIGGDFYYAVEKDGKKYLAVADCTGHGVPGALMSILCNDILKRAVEMHDMPHMILEQADIEIREKFKDGASKIHDGMDVSVICADYKSKKIHYSGAQRPIIKLSSDGSSELYKPTKRPIGSYHPQIIKFQFETTSIDLEEGDMYYLYSDGYQDQFGGKSDKKIGTRLFQKLITESSGTSFISQAADLNMFLENWKGEQNQIDDILIIGIKV